MVILGISALYHDAAAAIIVDGNITAAAQEERFTRIKNDLRDKYIIPYLNKQECDYITFDEELMKNDYGKLIVNDIDYHLNEFGHRIIANKLINTIPEFK